MKKLLLIVFVSLYISGFSQSVTPVLYPLYVQGVGSGNPAQDLRVPYACRMTVSGLLPNAAYRYYSRFVFDVNDGTNGVGTPVIVNQTGSFTRATTASLGTAGGYGEFTTDGAGSYTGWFAAEPNSDPLFQPGTQLRWRIMLNNGAGGSTVVLRLHAADPVTVINWGTSAGSTVQGSAFWGATNLSWIPKNFVMLFDNSGGSGRPISGTYVESEGLAAGAGFAPWYTVNISPSATATDNRWGTIIPNNLSNGIRNIRQFSLSTGLFLNECTSADGIWSAQNQAGTSGLTTNTVNPNWGQVATYNSSIPRNVSCSPSVACNITLSSAVINVACFGQSTGAIDLTVNNATAPITYAWTGPGGFTATTQDITGLAAGTYNVTVTDAGNCTASASISVTQPAAALSASTTVTNILCSGQSTGSIDLTVSGGTSPYSYAWTGPGGFTATTQDISGLAAGTYSVTITDANNCTAATSAAVNQPPALSGSTSITNVLCFGQSTGAVDLSVSGGTSPYTYAWTGPGGFTATTQDISGLAAGVYNVIITDANSCTTTASGTVSQPASALSAGTSVINATCGASNGAIDLTVTGGTSPYTYAWTGPGGFTATTQDISGLAAGVYNVTVTDANNCTAVAGATVNNSGGPVITVDNITHVLCSGQSTGAIAISVSGGSSPYTYSWTGPGGFTATTQNISSLAAGTYTVSVTDAASCTTTANVTVNQPSAISATTSVTNVLCFSQNNGAIDLTVSGGTSPYTYAWTGPGGFTATTQDISGLAAGVYNVTITDANGCTATASATVSQPAAALSASTSVTDVLCFGQSTGAVDLTVSGGTSPYTYSWTGPGGYTASIQDISGLAAGIYNVTVTDANGCTATASAAVGQPASALNASASATNATCGASNGSVNLIVNGGTSPYTFLWSNGATTQNISGLAPGTYSVTVTDVNGCTATASASVSSTGGPSVIVSSAINVLCSGQSTGAIDITVSGGTAPYTFAWTGPGGFTSATEDITGLAAGAYSVSVTDANGCISSASATITEPSSALNTSAAATSAACGASNGSINLTVSGGTSPYTYAWTGPGGFTAATEDISGLAPGTYNVTVTDANGCTSTAVAVVNNISGPTVAVSSTGNVLCFGQSTGAVDITVTGGTPPFTYAWTGPGGFTAATEDISGLAAGTYNVTVTDANGCSSSAGATITEPSSALTASATATSATCSSSNGSINLTVAGGTSPYTYAWTGPGGFIAATEDISGLAPGTYNVTVTDVNGCTITAAAVVNNISGPSVSISSTVNVLCFGQTNGAVNISVTGGTSPYTYLWNNGATTQNISGVQAGAYSVTVTDANGCTATASATITQPQQLALTETHTPVPCFGDNSTVTISATGGTPPYTGTGSFVRTAGTYTFNVTDANGCTSSVNVTVTQPAQLTSSATQTAVLCSGGNSTIIISAAGGTPPYTGTGTFVRTAGTYTFTVADANGCTSATTVTITQPVVLTASSGATSVLCNGGNATVTVTAGGGTAPYTGTGTFTRTAGTYTFTVTDANGCTAATTITISQPNILTATSVASAIACNGGTSTITVSATGGTAPYTGTGTFTRPTGTYSFTITDANGCTAVTSVTVTQPSVLTAAASADIITQCGGTTLVTVTGSGGTQPYSYPGAGNYRRGPGTWEFTVQDAAGCTANTEITIAAPECLKVYPNPAKNTITVSHTRTKAGAVMIIYSIAGNKVLTIQVPQGSIVTPVDLRKLAAGSYVLVFWNDGTREEARFEKSN